MFDIGWTEMMVVAVVAILFVGPKELPGMLRTFGRSVKKLRSMAGDFQKQFNDALEDAELDSVKDTLNEVRNLNPANKIKDHLNPIKQDLKETKKLVEDAGDFDPLTAFDESKLPDAPKPVEVDVEAALNRQREADAVEKAELAAETKKVAVKKAPKKKSPARKTAVKSSSATNARSKAPVKPRTSTKASDTKAKTTSPKAKGVATKSKKAGEYAKKTSAKAKSTAKAGA